MLAAAAAFLEASGSAGGVTTIGCGWDSLSDRLTITIITGIPPEQLTLSAKSRSEDSCGTGVAGVGDRAWVFSMIPASAEVDVVVGQLAVNVELIRGGNGLHDQLVAVTEAALGRL